MVASNNQKIWCTEIFKQFLATIMTTSQSDTYERGSFQKIWMEYYSLGKNHASGTLSSKLIRCQNPYHLPEQKRTWDHMIFIHKIVNEMVK